MVLILRKPRSGCLEGRTTLIQAIFDFLTTSDADGLRAAFAEAHRRYTGAIDARFRWTGRLFQGRFGAVVMDEPHLFGGGALHRAQSGGRGVGEPCRRLAMVEHPRASG